MKAAQELAELVNVKASCDALAVARPSYYRRCRPPTPKPAAVERPPNPRRYSDAERDAILQVLNSKRFCDKSPEQVEAILAEEGKRIASARTMYRILAALQQVRERRNRRRHFVHHTPRLVAHGPNEVWSWDISRLKGPEKGIWYMLYVALDIYSRFVVGWLLAERENSKIAQHFLRETMRKQGIEPGQLTVHQDRGSPMRAKSTMELLDDLGAGRSYSRPQVSNDNPFSESHFGTIKQRPDLPDRLANIEHGRQVLREIYSWYNYEHHHSGIMMLTPAQVHLSQADQMLAKRHALRMAAYEANPLRFISGPPSRQQLPAEVWINPPVANADTTTRSQPGSEEVLH